MPDESLEILKKIDRTLSALLVIAVDQHLRSTDLAKPRPRSIDRMLADVGLSNTEIGRLLGKTQSAVSQSLSKDGKSKGGATPDDGGK
jgi:DNA-binding transcriptional ArsR family regulator